MSDSCVKVPLTFIRFPTATKIMGALRPFSQYIWSRPFLMEELSELHLVAHAPAGEDMKNTIVIWLSNGVRWHLPSALPEMINWFALPMMSWIDQSITILKSLSTDYP